MPLSIAEKTRRYRQNLRKRAFEAIGSKCIFCKTENDLQAAHVIDTGLNGASRGMDRRYRDILKNPDSYRPMCKGCHRTFDKVMSQIRKNQIDEESIPF